MTVDSPLIVRNAPDNLMRADRPGSARRPATAQERRPFASRSGRVSAKSRPKGPAARSNPGCHRRAHRGTAWHGGYAAWYHWLVETGPVSFEVVP